MGSAPGIEVGALVGEGATEAIGGGDPAAPSDGPLVGRVVVELGTVDGVVVSQAATTATTIAAARRIGGFIGRRTVAAPRA